MLIPFLQELLLETVPERRVDSAREGNKSSKDFLGRVSRGTVILLYVIFGGGESLVAGDITVQEVVGIARVVELVGVESIFSQGEHVVECSIEGEVVAQVVVEEEVVEEEVEMVNAAELVEEEVLEKRH